MIAAISSEAQSAWAIAAHPGELFIALWNIATSWEPADRAVLPQPALTTRRQLAAAVAHDDGADSVAAITSAMKVEWPAGASHVEKARFGGIILEAMHAIEDAFIILHPRTRVIPPSLGGISPSPRWVEHLERQRMRNGSYAETEACRLIPSGPFSRYARGRDASAANTLQDNFPFLTVAPCESSENGRTIAIDMKVIGTDAMRGVPGSRSIGRERVRFIPLAEAKDDLVFKTLERNGQPMLDVRPTLDTAARLLEALRDGANIDIAFAPELTVPSEKESQLREGIAELAGQSPRITLAGSGLSVETAECGRPWNEARVFGRGGHILWHQRKIWPFGMPRTSALHYGFPDPGDQQTLMEDVAGHSRITVVDLDGFGRCVVLICQDVQAHPVVEEIVEHYQPDWILTPVLDPGVKAAGWAHQRAVELSKRSQARILVGSSLTLSQYPHACDEPAVGLAVGPADPAEGPGREAIARAFALVSAPSGPSPRHGLLVWDHDPTTWQQSNLTVG